MSAASVPPPSASTPRSGGDSMPLREVIARALIVHTCCEMCEPDWETWLPAADAVLDALELPAVLERLAESGDLVTWTEMDGVVSFSCYRLNPDRWPEQYPQAAPFGSDGGSNG